MKSKTYITTSIAYTNALPHIGFALEVIQADLLARYNRLSGREIFFLTGTDEHGLKVEKAAQEAGMSPAEFSEKISSRFLELKKLLNLSNNDFIKTTDEKRHIPTVNYVWNQLKENGDLYKKDYQGYYCVGCEAFVTEKDLIDGKCPIHKSVPQLVKEENYFFKLSKYQDRLISAIEKDEIRIIPEERKNEILNFAKQGLEDISFSRSIDNLKWGIPVPGDGKQIIYVWGDALINYISAIGYLDNKEKFNQLWPADIQCIGKDIIRFHALYWPAILFSLNLPLPRNILIHGFITSNGEKMSKSLGNIIDPFKIVEKHGADSLRYYLLREIPTTKDGDFSIERFEGRYNDDLASGLGNLISRVLTMVDKYSQGKVPLVEEDPGKHPLRIDENIYNWKKSRKGLDENITEFNFNQALACIWNFISEADRYIEKEKPWELFEKGKIKELNWALYGLLDAIHQIAWQIYPFLPETSLKIAEALSIQGLLKENPQDKDSLINIKPGLKLKKLDSLFPRIK